jgi:hypothetical protein
LLTWIVGGSGAVHDDLGSQKRRCSSGRLGHVDILTREPVAACNRRRCASIPRPNRRDRPKQAQKGVSYSLHGPAMPATHDSRLRTRRPSLLTKIRWFLRVVPSGRAWNAPAIC